MKCYHDYYTGAFYCFAIQYALFNASRDLSVCASLSNFINLLSLLSSYAVSESLLLSVANGES
jgi:hypothetical protein